MYTTYSVEQSRKGFFFLKKNTKLKKQNTNVFPYESNTIWKMYSKLDYRNVTQLGYILLDSILVPYFYVFDKYYIGLKLRMTSMWESLLIFLANTITFHKNCKLVHFIRQTRQKPISSVKKLSGKKRKLWKMTVNWMCSLNKMIRATPRLKRLI